MVLLFNSVYCFPIKSPVEENINIWVQDQQQYQYCVSSICALKYIQLSVKNNNIY